MALPLKPRLATSDDLEAITEIYNHAILHTTATFDTEPRTAASRMPWFEAHHGTHPIFVVEIEQKIFGWGCLSAWSDRCAYSGCAEISIYVDPTKQKQGLGSLLLKTLLASARKSELRTVLARISSDNAHSVRMHQRQGFVVIGTMRQVGEKFGKILDVELLQTLL